MTTNVEISLEDTGQKGRYIAHVDGQQATGELTYSRANATTIIANHTGVPDALGGMGVGKALVNRLFSDAREQGFKVIPQCSFVLAMSKRHPEWADLVQ